MLANMQITRASLRVLGNKPMTSGTLQAEWTPPISTMQSAKGLSLQRDPLHHGAIISAGAVVAGNATIYSVQLDELGIPHTLSTNVRPHQVPTYFNKSTNLFSKAPWLINPKLGNI
jgi:hypothetical protein